MPHPYRRQQHYRRALPEVGISENGNIRSLHLGTPTVQSAMNLDNPPELVLSYSRAMMAWLLFAEQPPAHITQIGLGGGSFARWLAEYLPDTRQTAVDVNPQVITVARAMFVLPPEGGTFEIIEADGAEYVKTLRGGTDVILTDGFDGEQIIDALVSDEYFADCRRALSRHGIFVTNWWQGDKRYPQFCARLREAFDGRVLALPAETHGNAAVLAFQTAPVLLTDTLKKRADALSAQYGLDFKCMLADLKAENGCNGRSLRFQAA
ncbi:polyamine aminopropyltransferase [Conchiformibius kuhniae]|uniref:Polyamine aminopropyltransferase n=1 Tax=Conchiformibius kuhniae TaxID=211502 RepID=A0A8T9MTZ8_9NEIS|nr:polyamine aminopropyltransferase [Conchiformibius kuhniae]UOP04731.1 polyamine aminopropyltransferase [Conchiformibius kuhniae]